MSLCWCFKSPPAAFSIMSHENKSSPGVSPTPVPGLNNNMSRDNADSISLESIESNYAVDNVLPLQFHLDDQDSESLQVDLAATKSGRSLKSTKSHRVPIKERRGLLGKITLLPEYDDAREYPDTVKYTIVVVIAFASLTGPFGTSIMLPAIDDIVKDLHTNETMVNISVGIYLLSLGIFPIWWSSFLERYGRRTVYLVSFSMFFAFSIGAAFAPSISALIGLRVLQGGCSASVQAVGAGTISDLFIQQEMGRAMGLYYLGPLLGPFCAPIIGGVVGQVWGWRATQWALAIVSGVNVFSILFLLPETLRKFDASKLKQLQRVSTKKDLEEGSAADEEEDEKGEKLLDDKPTRVRSDIELEGESAMLDPVMPSLSRLSTNMSQYSRRLTAEARQEDLERTILRYEDEKITSFQWPKVRRTMYDLFIRPTHSLVLLAHPPVALVIAYSAISFMTLYFLNMTISWSYARDPYNFKVIIIGLMYIPNSVTYIIASVLGGRWIDKLLRDYAAKHDGRLDPESRLSWNVVLAIAMFMPACLIFGWTIKFGLHWVIPLIGTALFGAATMLLIGAMVTYLVDTLPGRGATGVALNNLIRQIFAAVATFVVEPILRKIGQGVLFSILSGVLLVSSVLLLIVKRKGQYFRDHSKLALLYEKL